MNIELQYFKRTGKYYSSGELTIKDGLQVYEIVSHVKRLKESRCLPDLVRGHSDFIIYIKENNHPNIYPVLIL